MSADRLAACQSGDGLVHHSLKNGGGEVLTGRAVVDERLDIGLCKHTAAGGDGIKRFVVLRIFVQAHRIRLDQRCHLVDKGTRTAGADAVHTLFHIAIFKIDDLGVFAAQLDGYIGLGGKGFQRSGDRQHFLYKDDLQMFCKSETTGARDHGTDGHIPQSIIRLFEQSLQCLADIGKMPLIIRKQDVVRIIDDRNLHGGGADINTQTVDLILTYFHFKPHFIL